MDDGLLARLRRIQQSYLLFTILRRPRTAQEAISRIAVVGAVAIAVAAPFFIGATGGDAAEGAGAEFSARLIELQELQNQRDAEGSSADLDAQIAALEAETQLGYLQRDGDASVKGALAPDFRLLDLEGQPHRLSEIDGPIVLNFWASWCEPCIEEMPEFEEVHREAAGQVTFIGVNDGESLETARTFAYDVTGVSYTVLLDPTKSMTDGPYLLVGRPTTLFIGDDGIIKDIRVGIVPIDTMRELVAELIGQELGGEPEVVPEDYREAALNVIESARANFAVAADLAERWLGNPNLLVDPGWSRNMEAQSYIWFDLAEQFDQLTPPNQWAALHEHVSDSLEQMAHAVGPLVREAIETRRPAGMETALILFDSFRETFDTAADNLVGVIDTQ